MNQISKTPKSLLGGSAEGSNSSIKYFTSKPRHSLSDYSKLIQVRASQLCEVIKPYNYVTQKTAVNIFLQDIKRHKTYIEQGNHKQASERILRSYLRAKTIAENLENHFRNNEVENV